MACPACNSRLDDALLADGEALHIRTEFRDDAAELVAERDGDRVVRARVRFHGREGRAAEILVQISAADTYVRGRDLFAGLVARSSKHM